MTRLLFSTLAILAAVLLQAGEPKVVEQQRGDGLTELRVVSDAGQTLATYQVDLKTHHEPATNDSGLIRQWENHRFGGFFCFNDNQYDGHELSQNKDAKLYRPTQLDVAGWAVTMKNAGMKYTVLTVRHTSGFLLWDSAASEFDVASSPNQTDVAGEFVKQCRKQGIAPGFYYCLWGGKAWMPHPNARAIILAQLHELASRYGEIPYFWIDMPNWRPPDLSTQEIYDAIKNQQPQAVVILNQSIQNGRVISYFPTDVVNGEVALPPAGGHQPFRRVNGKRYYLPFEFEPVSQSIRDATMTPTTTPWGQIGAWFTFGEGKGFPASQPIPAKQLFAWIKQAYDRGSANVFLSLAADHTGSMRPDDVRQLGELGKMLREAGLLEVPKATVPPAVSLAMGKPAQASGVWENNVPQYGPAAAFDDDPATRWGGPVGARAGWLEVDLGRETAVSCAVIQEGWDRTRRFSVQYKVGNDWKDAATGTTIGENLKLKFAPVTARVFRLNITDATDVPTIWEFQLFPPKK
ncbi:MAG: alpha-L-fucosidase [Akkermansiaceae bacterium]|nr:alpha-L-fucosidase [Akkermansiaceae bacterium]